LKLQPSLPHQNLQKHEVYNESKRPKLKLGKSAITVPVPPSISNGIVEVVAIVATSLHHQNTAISSEIKRSLKRILKPSANTSQVENKFRGGRPCKPKKDLPIECMQGTSQCDS